jgi:hypothetical protein
MPPKSIWLPKNTENYKVKIDCNVKDRVTVGLTVNAIGQKFEPVIIFAGSEKGRIFH